MSQNANPLFELKNLPPKLIVDNFYLNNLHYLHPFTIVNVSSSSLIIRLRSNIPSQILFQSSNENYPRSSLVLSKLLDKINVEATVNYTALSPLDSPTLISETPPLLLSTTTQLPSQTGDATYLNNFNELFNSVSYLDELRLDVGQQQDIILTFLPDTSCSLASEPSSKSNRIHIRPTSPMQRVSFSEAQRVVKTQNPSNMLNSNEESQQIANSNALVSGTNASLEEPETYDFFEVNGLIFISAYRTPSDLSVPILYDNRPEIRPQLESTPEGIFSYKKREKDAMSEDDGSESNNSGSFSSPSSAMAALTPIQQKAEFQQMIKFKAKVCCSFLSSDIDGSEITFDDCVIGNTLFKDFTVWNRSEIPLHWTLNVINPNLTKIGVLDFLDYDSGEILDMTPIGSYSYRRVRLRYKPNEVGEISYDIQLENLNDPTNIEYIRVHAIIRATHSQEPLIIKCSGNSQSLDFGDCYAGIWCAQSMIVKNVSHSPLELNFSSDGALGEVTFALKTKGAISNINMNPQTSSIHIGGQEFPNSESPVSSGTISPVLRKKHIEKYFTNDNLISAFVENMAMTESNLNSTGQNSENDPNATEYVEMPQIEDLVLPAGAERVIIVNFKPTCCRSIDEYQAGRLLRKIFKVNIDYSGMDIEQKEKKILQCRSRICTSFIDVQPLKVNFGDTDVWTLKSSSITVLNRSEMPAQVRLQFISKVLNAYNGIVTIPPFQSKEIKIDIYPRKINPDYRKQITIINCLNRDNDRIIEVRSTNVDKHRVTFHSLYYRILTPSSSNFLDFGPIVINSPTVRAFMIQNISKKKLTLELSTSFSDEIKLFCKNESEPKSTTFPTSLISKNKYELIQKILEAIEQKHGGLHSTSRKKSTHSKDTNIREQEGQPFTIRKFENTNSHLVRKTSTMGKHKSVKPIKLRSPIDTLQWLDLAGSINHGRKKQTSSISGEQSFLLRRNNSFQKPPKAEFTIQKNNDGSPIPIARENASKVGKFSIQESATTSRSVPPLERGEIETSENVDQNVLFTESSSYNIQPFSLDLFLGVIEQSNSSLPPPFPCYSAEEKFIRYHVALRQELNSVISEKKLIPFSLITIPPDSQKLAICLFSPLGSNHPQIQDKARKQDARIFCRLVDFDRDIENSEFENLVKSEKHRIPVREVMVRATMFRSTMDLEQKNINFGFVSKNERHTKTIVIRNRSEAPLYYMIRKSGSIASDDIILSEGSVGVVRGFAKREVEFIFDPSLAGTFHEKLVIENLQDNSNNQVLSIKAIIRKQTNFSIKSLWVDFGVCLINERCCTVQQIVISNTSTKHTRTFQIHADTKELNFFNCVGEFDFEFIQPEESGFQSMGVVTKEMEEKIENYEQKLKIARRKGRLDKVKKIETKIQKLKRGEADEENWQESKEIEASAPVVLNHRESFESNPFTNTFKGSPKLQKSSSSPFSDHKATLQSLPTPSSSTTAPFKVMKKSKNSILVSLEPSSVKTITVSFLPVIVSNESDIQQETCCGRIYVNEYKNTDVVKTITFRSIVCYDHETYIQALQTEALIADGGESYVDVDGSYRESNLNSENASTCGPLSRSNTQLSLLSGTCGDDSLVGKGFPDSSSPCPESLETTNIIETPSFAIVNKLVDLGKIELNKVANGYVLVKNTGNNECNVMLKALFPESSDANEVIVHLKDFTFAEEKGVSVPPLETKRCDFSFIPMGLGRGFFHVSLKLLENNKEDMMVVQYHVLQPRYLNFPSLLSDGAELNLGYCYVNANTPLSKMVPFEIENATDEALWITAQSNLQNQVFIMPDWSEDKKKSVTDQYLPKGSKITLWIGVQPSFPPIATNASSVPIVSSNGNGMNGREIEVSESRNLIGGIKFQVSAKSENSIKSSTVNSEGRDEEYIFLVTETVRFNATVGRSIMQLSTSLIDFGVTDSLGIVFPAEFWIYNSSSLLPLEYDIEMDDDVHIVQPFKNVLEGWDVTTDHSTAKSLIQFQVVSNSFGYYNKLIRIINKNNPSQILTVELRLFVDPKVICIRNTKLNINDDKIEAICAGDEDHLQLQMLESGLQLPCLRWEAVYLHSSNLKGETYNIASPSYGITKHFVNDRIIELMNTSENTISILPISDVGLEMYWIEDMDLAKCQGSNLSLESAFSNSKLLTPMRQTYLLIKCPPPDSFFTDYTQFESGKLFHAKGILKMINSINSEALKVLSLHFTYCVSLGELSPILQQLGDIGHSNHWRNLKFQFSLHNLSEAMLYYRFDIPEYIWIKNDLIPSRSIDSIGGYEDSEITEAVLCPKETCEFFGVIKTSYFQKEITPRKITGEIKLINKYNPLNTQTITVEASLTLFELKFDGLVHGELILPPIQFPQTSSTPPSDTWFTVVNTSDHDVTFEVGMHFHEEVSKFVTVEIRSRFSNSPLTGLINLGRKGSIEVRVLVFPNEQNRLLPDNLIQYLSNPAGFSFGKLWISTKQATIEGTEENDIELESSEDIPIKGSIVESNTFSVSDSSLRFRTKIYTDSDNEEGSYAILPNNEAINKDDSHQVQQETVVIYNLSDTLPLQFQLMIDGPSGVCISDHLKISPIDDQMSGTVPAGGKLPLSFEWFDVTANASDEWNVHIYDVNSITKQQQTIQISIIPFEEGRRQMRGFPVHPQHSLPRLLSSSQIPEVISEGIKDLENSNIKLLLRGCRHIVGDEFDSSVGERYDLDLGQQDLTSTTIVKKIFLKNLSCQKLSYRIRALTSQSNSKPWITVSPNEGTLEPTGVDFNDTHVIVLNVFPSARSVFISYIIIENLDCPTDSKSIRVSMEVVAKQNIRRSILMASGDGNRVFDIFVNDMNDPSHTIDMKGLYYDTEYTSRSIVIHNRETVPLQFNLKPNIDKDDPSELLFSTSRTSLKLFKSLTIEPESNTRIYLRFIPSPSAQFKELAFNSEKPLDDLVEEKVIELSINCRLVKDYEKMVYIRASCHFPQFSLSKKEFIFNGDSAKLNLEEANFEELFQPRNDELIISSIRPPLYFSVVGETIFFNIQGAQFDEVYTISGDSPKFKIIITPNYDNIRLHSSFIKKEKYIQEYISVYNRQTPFEYTLIPLRLSLGKMRNFNTIFGFRPTHTYDSLENRIIHFLNEFGSYYAENKHLIVFQQGSLTTVENSGLSGIKFRLHCIVDQLIYFATHSNSGEYNFFQLAYLLFSIFYTHDAFNKNKKIITSENVDIADTALAIRQEWFAPFGYFVSFFPYRNPVVDALRDLYHSLT